MSQQIEHTAVINHIEGTNMRVSIIQESACSGCHAKGACSAADMAEKFVDIECSNPNLKVGDIVQLYGQSSTGLLAVLLAFVIPFLLILLTLLLLRSYVSNEAVSGSIALSTLIPYYIILSFFNKKMKSKFQFFIKDETA